MIEFKLFSNQIEIPTKFPIDLYATSWYHDSDNDTYVYGVGFSFSIPENYACGVVLNQFNNNCYLLNPLLFPTIDNEIQLLFQHRDMQRFKGRPFKTGELIGQLILFKLSDGTYN